MTQTQYLLLSPAQKRKNIAEAIARKEALMRETDSFTLRQQIWSELVQLRQMARELNKKAA